MCSSGTHRIIKLLQLRTCKLTLLLHYILEIFFNFFFPKSYFDWLKLCGCTVIIETKTIKCKGGYFKGVWESLKNVMCLFASLNILSIKQSCSPMLDEAINLTMHADEPHLIPIHLLPQIMLSDKPPQIMGLLFFWGKEANEGSMIFRLTSSERSKGLQ